MLKQIFENSAAKQICYTILILLIFSTVGVGRSFTAFLFYQLDLEDSKITLNNDEKGWIASSLGFLSPVGSILGGVLSDALGRKMSMVFMFIPILISWVVTAFATNFMMLFIGGILRGLGIGMLMCLITYTAEIASTKLRGLLLSLVDVTFNFGVIICTLLMKYIAWDTVSFIFTAFMTFSLLSVIILPESPIWLYSKGKIEKAVQTLCSLRNSSPEQLTDEIDGMKNSCMNKKKESSIMESIQNVLNAWRQLLITFFFMILITHAGHYIFLPYLVDMIDELRIPIDSTDVAVYFSIVGFIGSFLTPFFVHNLNRKTTLSLSSLGMGISVAIMVIYEEIYLYRSEKPFAAIVPIALCSFVGFSNLGVVPLSFVIGGELYPLEGRGTLQGIFACMTFAYYSVSVKIYPFILASFGIKAVLWSFTAFCFAITLFAIFILPETRGKTLEEIQDEYFRKPKTNSVALTAVRT